MTNFLTSAG